MAIRLHPSAYVHPGRWLAEEIVAPANIKGGVTRLAAGLGVTRQALSALLNGRADLSANTAIRFEKAFGIRADTLMRMQTAYDLAQARAHEDAMIVERMAKAA
jgi:addiction module HigA family antidote